MVGAAKKTKFQLILIKPTHYDDDEATYQRG